VIYFDTAMAATFDSTERSCLSKEARAILRPHYLCHDFVT
jgi:hypothetical protein